MEKAQLQYVSGECSAPSDCRPAAGRLLGANDDVTPGANAYAVLSNDYWTRRFGRDPNVLGRTFQSGQSPFRDCRCLQGAFYRD